MVKSEGLRPSSSSAPPPPAPPPPPLLYLLSNDGDASSIRPPDRPASFLHLRLISFRLRLIFIDGGPLN